MSKLYSQKKTDAVYYFLASAVIIALANWAFNQSIRVLGLFMDDLSYWSIFQNSENLWEFIWNTVSYKLRPVANVFMGIGFKVVGSNTHLLADYILTISFFTALTIWYAVHSIFPQEKVLPLMASVLALASRCVYYTVGQYFGVMENVATSFAILTLMSCVMAVQEANRGREPALLLRAIGFAILSILSHERYIVLFPVVLIAVVLSNTTGKKKVLLSLCACCVLALYIIIREIIYGVNAWMGTGGTNMLEGIDLAQILKFFGIAVLFLFGGNFGEAYLFGHYWQEVPVVIYCLNSVVVCIFVGLVALALRAKVWKTEAWKKYIILFAFCGATILCGCTTIRLEMRWLYTPFVGFIILIIALLTQCKENHKMLRKIACILCFSSMLITEFYFRTGFGNIYLWDVQNIYNQIYTTTIQNNIENLQNKRIVLISNNYPSVTQKTMSEMFSLYANSKQCIPPEVEVYSSWFEVDNDSDQETICLWIEPTISGLESLSQVSDITKIYESINVGADLRSAILDSGFYGWEGGNKDFIITAGEFSFYVKTGLEGKLTLTGTTPAFNVPNSVTVFFDDREIDRAEINSENVSFTVNIPADSTGKITIKMDHAYVPYEMGEGEDRRQIGLILYDAVTE